MESRGRRAPDPDAPQRSDRLITRRQAIGIGVGAGVALTAAGAATFAFAADEPETRTVWQLTPDWDEPRGPHRKIRLESNASRIAAANRYAQSEDDALDMNLHVGSWAPAVAVVVNRAEFDDLWSDLSYEWRSPWSGRSVRLFDARHAARTPADAERYRRALAVAPTTTTTVAAPTTTSTTTAAPMPVDDLLPGWRPTSSTTAPATMPGASVAVTIEDLAPTTIGTGAPAVDAPTRPPSTVASSTTATSTSTTSTTTPASDADSIAPTSTAPIGAARTGGDPSDADPLNPWLPTIGAGVALAGVAAAVGFRRRRDAPSPDSIEEPPLG